MNVCNGFLDSHNLVIMIIFHTFVAILPMLVYI